MNVTNLFEVAIRERYRFPYKGWISAEDLWDLSLVDLDSIFKELNKQSKEVKEESLLTTRTKETTKVDRMIEIIKYVVTTKQEEADKAKDVKNRKEKKQYLLKVLEEKKLDELKGKSSEELEKLIEEL